MDLSELQEIALGCDRTGNFSPLEAALASSIAMAPDAASVWSALSLEVIGDVAFGDGQLPNSVITAIVQRALELGEAELLGIAVRLTAYDPGELAGDGSGWKDRVRTALGSQADCLREAWNPGNPELCAQIAHAIAVTDAASPADASRLKALVTNFPSQEVLALGLLASTVREFEGRAALVRASLEHHAPLVRLMAAVAVARAGEPLDATACAAIRTALLETSRFPPWWAFRTFDQDEASDALALRFIHWAAVEVPAPLVDAIAARPDLGWRESEILQRLAFPGGIDPLGVVAAELTASQRTVITAYGSGPLASLPGGLHSFGLARAQDVEPFLAERGPLWSLRSVELPSGAARWPAIRIWKARVWDVVSHQAALEALTPPLAAADLLELTCTKWRGVLLQSIGRSRGGEHKARDHDLMIAALRAIHSSEFDLAAAVATMLQDPGRWDLLAIAAAALIVMAGTDLSLETEQWEVLARGVEIAKQHECFVALLNATNGSVRQHLDEALD